MTQDCGCHPRTPHRYAVEIPLNRTASRAQRHKYKKRLQEVGKTHPEWSGTAEEDRGSVSELIFKETLMSLEYTEKKFQ